LKKNREIPSKTLFLGHLSETGNMIYPNRQGR